MLLCSLFNYTIFHGVFYCTIHYKLVAEAEGGKQERNANAKSKHQSLQAASPEQELLHRNYETGKTLMRAKRQTILSGLRLDDGLRLPRQTTQLGHEFGLQHKLRTSWPPFKEATEKNVGGEMGKPGTSNTSLQGVEWIPHPKSKAGGITHRALEGKSVGEMVSLKGKQPQLPSVTISKRGEHASRPLKPMGRSGELGVLEKRLLFMDRSIPRARGQIQDRTISEESQHNPLKLKRIVDIASPLKPAHPNPSSFGPFLSHSKAHRTANVADFAQFATPGASRPAPAIFKDNKVSGCSSTNSARFVRNAKQTPQRVDLRPQTRIKLPVLALPDNGPNRKLREASISNVAIALNLEKTRQLNHVDTEPKQEMEDRKSAPIQPEGLIHLTEHNGEKSNEATNHVERTPASCPDSLETHPTTAQISEPRRVGRNELPGNVMQLNSTVSLQGPESQLYPDTYSKEAEVEKEKARQPGKQPESAEIQIGIPEQALQNTTPERRAISSVDEPDLEDGQPASSSQVVHNAESMTVPPRKNPRLEATWTCNVTLSVNDSPGPDDLPGELKMTNGDLPSKAGSESNLDFKCQEGQLGGIINQAFKPPAKEPGETLKCCESPYSTKNIAIGNEDVDTNVTHQGSTVSSIQDKVATDGADRKQPLKKERNASAFKNQSGAPRKEPVRIKKAPKTQSALAMLFRYSSDKDKSQKDGLEKALVKPFVKANGDAQTQVRCHSSFLKVGTPQKEETSEAGILAVGNSEANLQSSEENYENCSREQQNDTPPRLSSTKAISTDTFLIVLDSDISRPAAGLSETTNLDVPERSTLNVETVSQADAEIISPNSLVTTENVLQQEEPLANPTEETSPENLIYVAARADKKHDKDLFELPWDEQKFSFRD